MNRPRTGSAARRANHLQQAFHQLLRDATDDQTARVMFTHEWHYTNKHHAIIHGLPQCLSLCRPSSPTGGRTMQNRLLRLIKTGDIYMEILSPTAFATRRQRAAANGRFVPLQRKRRSDMSHPHARTKAYLWDRPSPSTTEEVTREMEGDVYVYPGVQRPKRVSNVERRRRAAREEERRKRVRV